MAYGARAFGSMIAGVDDLIKQFKSGATIAAGDFVNVDGSGELDFAAATELILGVSEEAATSSSVGVAVNLTPGLRVIMDNDDVGGAFSAADVLEYFDTIGTTGIVQVDTSSTSTSTGQLMCWEYNPQGYGFDTDISIGLYTVNEHVANF